MATATRYLGTSDDVTTCDCCGRSDLKSTVALEIEEAVVHFGVTCAAKALKVGVKEIRQGTRGADLAAAELKRAADKVESDAEHARWSAFLNEHAPSVPVDWGGRQDILGQIKALGGFAAARELYVRLNPATKEI